MADLSNTERVRAWRAMSLYPRHDDLSVWVVGESHGVRWPRCDGWSVRQKCESVHIQHVHAERGGARGIPARQTCTALCRMSWLALVRECDPYVAAVATRLLSRRGARHHESKIDQRGGPRGSAQTRCAITLGRFGWIARHERSTEYTGIAG